MRSAMGWMVAAGSWSAKAAISSGITATDFATARARSPIWSAMISALRWLR
jgi:hypothetical protein